MRLLRQSLQLVLGSDYMDTDHPLCDGKGCYKCNPPLSDVTCPYCKKGKLTMENKYEYDNMVNCNYCHSIFIVHDDEL